MANMDRLSICFSCFLPFFHVLLRLLLRHHHLLLFLLLKHWKEAITLCAGNRENIDNAVKVMYGRGRLDVWVRAVTRW